MSQSSFNTQAIPSPFGNTNSGLFGSVGKALNLPASQPTATPTTAPQFGVTPMAGMLPNHSSPSTPLKSLTTNPDGTTTSTYHQPTTNVPADVAAPKVATPANDVKQGQSFTDTQGNQGVAQFDPKTGQSYASMPASSTGPGTNGNNGSSFNQNLSNVQATGNQTGNEQQTFSGLLGQSQNESPAYTNAMSNYDTANKNLADYNSQLAQTDKNISAQGISLDSSRGQMANVGQAATAEEAALQGAVTGSSNVLGAANTQQGLQVQAGTAANSAAQTTAQRNLASQEGVAGLSAPQQVSPSNTLVSPTTGQGIYGLGSQNGNGSNAYQNFSNLQFNTQTGQALSKQANDLSTAANQTDQNFNTLNSTLGGLNVSQFPTFNALNQALQQQAGGAGKVSAMNEAVNALQTSLSQIISSGTSGLTPSTISQLTNNQAINTLSPSQLQTLYDTVKQTMATKINTLQDQALQSEKAGTGFNNNPSASSTATNLSNNTLPSKVVSGNYSQNSDGSWFYNK